MPRAMTDIDVIIPCYGSSDLIDRGVSSLANQWKREYIHVTLVDDCSPNTDCHYQDLIDRYKDKIDIRCIVMPENSGQGLARQYGIDHTENQWFMFMDEDDMYPPLSISLFVGAMEAHGMKIRPDGTVETYKSGKPKYYKNRLKVGVVSGPLFEFDDNHTHVIPSDNGIWLNSKLYNREFIEKHNIRFNKEQSRHAEDYYFMNCFFHCLNNDPDYLGIMLDDNGLYYIWYPNEESQSRIDPNYGFMLSGYTMQGSVNIIKFIEDTKRHGIEITDDVRAQLEQRILNSTVYSFYTFLSFIRHVASTDYEPKDQEWYLLRDACNDLREMCKANWNKYPYMRWVQELYTVKSYSDVQYSEPWVAFDKYILDGTPEFQWDFNQLLECKKTYKFNEEGIKV